MADVATELLRTMVLGWNNADQGNYATARRCYDYANEIVRQIPEIQYMETDPDLQLIRHRQGSSDDFIKSYPVDEDHLLAIDLHGGTPPCDSSEEMVLPVNYRLHFPDYHPEPYHLDNIQSVQSHVMVLSTGRSGTMSLFRLFQQSHYLTYHSYFYNVSSQYRLETMCRVFSGDFSDTTCIDEWVKTRAAEWVGATSQGKPMIGVNHLDTIFAPAFAKIHPHAKFIYLHRNPRDIFSSLYGKNQWSGQQLRPIYFKFTPEFSWCEAGIDIPLQIVWYIRFTEIFCREFGRIMGDRFIEISSDKLFDQDQEEIERLESFTGITVPDGYFAIPYNQKVHKQDDDLLESGLKVFDKYYGSFL